MSSTCCVSVLLEACMSCPNFTNTVISLSFDCKLIGEQAEKLEDALAEFLTKQGYDGVIEDTTTSNRTIFGKGCYCKAKEDYEKDPRCISPGWFTDEDPA